MYEIWKMYIENYSSYRVGTNVLTGKQTDEQSDRRTKQIPIGHPPSDGS